MKKLTLTTLMLVLAITSQGQILAERITIACGNHYFSEDNNYNNPALVVRGIWCGDSYFWAPVGEGDSIKELAYMDGELFTGTCIDLDTNGLLLGKYTFEDGLISRLEQFFENGQREREFNYKDGIAQGGAIRLTEEGLLDSFFFFENGKRSGYYYLSRDRTDWGLAPCIEFGKYENGESVVLTKPCFEDLD